MTRILVPAPDIEADVSAEQVTSYLLRPGSGWRYAGLDTEQCWQVYRLGRKRAELPVDRKMRRRASMLTDVITDIARAEQRHPSAVIADIVGPAVGVGGVGCSSVSPDERESRARYARRLRTERDVDSAAHGAGDAKETT